MLGFCSLKISFVLDNTVGTIAFVRVNINTDTVPTTTCLTCQLQHAYRVNYKMLTVSIIQHAYRVSTVLSVPGNNCFRCRQKSETPDARKFLTENFALDSIVIGRKLNH